MGRRPRRAVGARGDHRFVGAAAPDVGAARPRPGGAGDLRGPAHVTAAVPVDRFEHEALFYRGDEDFLAGLLPFIRDGLERDEAVVVAEPRPRLDQLRDALGTRRRGGRVPRHGRDRARTPAGSSASGPTASTRPPGRDDGCAASANPPSPAAGPREFAECTLHELLLNHAFDDGPGWRLLCPYDQDHLPRAVTQRRPAHAPGASRRRTRGCPAPPTPRAVTSPRSPSRCASPATPSCAGGYGPGDVPAIRRTVAQWARSCGLPEDRVACSSWPPRSWPPTASGTAAARAPWPLWLDDGAALVAVHRRRHPGRPADRPAAAARRTDGGRALPVNQLCDLVQVRSSDRGTTVRVTTWL